MEIDKPAGFCTHEQITVRLEESELRNLFAGLAMAGFLANPKIFEILSIGSNSAEEMESELARSSFSTAEAMLKIARDNA